jgi:hypothetical protein
MEESFSPKLLSQSWENNVSKIRDTGKRPNKYRTNPGPSRDHLTMNLA